MVQEGLTVSVAEQQSHAIAALVNRLASAVTSFKVVPNYWGKPSIKKL